MLVFFRDRCASYLYVIAFTSNLGHAGSDDSPYIYIVLRSGEAQHLMLYDRPGNDMLENKGDLWRIPIRQFHFREHCISKNSISQVLIKQGGNDGWNIESIMTMLDYDILTVDFHINRWIDGNGDLSHRQFALRLV